MNYEVNVEIVKQVSLFITFIKKLNLHLIYTSKYLQHFNLNIHHKSEKQHIIFDTLSQLTLTMSSETNEKNDKLNTLYAVNVLFVKTYAEMSDEF